MEIIVVGAGIGGLSTALSLTLAGHRVTIFESASALAEVGAGVQLTPNATRFFWSWGLGPDILAKAALPSSFNVREAKSGDLLGTVAFGGFGMRYGAPYLVIHRADIHKILHEHALKAGVEVRLGCRVVEYDFEGGAVMLADGQKLRAELIVGVDGINSSARGALLDSPSAEQDDTEPTGWAAYRAVAPIDAIRANPLTAHLASQHGCNCWVGQNRSAMTYMVKKSEILNIVLSHPDDVDTSDWTPERYQAEVRSMFAGCDPCVTALLEMTRPTIQNWPVHQVRLLPRWTRGKFVLVGDAAHGMAFYLSMGVSIAVEDAAALTECLSLRAGSDASLCDALTLFETVRKPRCDAVKEASLLAGNILHLPPGPARAARDAAMKDDGLHAADLVETDKFPGHDGASCGIASWKTRDWCYGYNVVAAVRAEWDANNHVDDSLKALI